MIFGACYFYENSRFDYNETEGKIYDANSARLSSFAVSRAYDRLKRSFAAVTKPSVLQLISVASPAVSFSIKVFSPVTSLIKSSSSSSSTTTAATNRAREACARARARLAILFHSTRYCNESNRDPILIGGSLRRDVSEEGNKKPERRGTVKIKWRSRKKEEATWKNEERGVGVEKKHKKTRSFMRREVARLIPRRFPCSRARGAHVV